MSKVIAHWATNHGIGTTSSTIAIATYLAKNYELKTLLSHSQYVKSSLENAFLTERENEALLKKEIGIDSLERLAKAGYLSNIESFDSYTKELIQDRLYLLIGSKKVKDSIFVKNTENTILSILDAARKYYSLINIDLNSGLYNKVTSKVIDYADVVVINIIQNEKILSDLFKSKIDWSDKLSKKEKIYIINRYDTRSIYSMKYIRSKFNIDGELFCIPYLTEFADYCNTHKALDFYDYMDNKNNEDYELFTEQVDEITKYLLEIIGFNVSNMFSPLINRDKFFSGIFNSFKRR